MLRSSGPRVDPCETPDNGIWKITVDVVNVHGLFLTLQI